MLLPNLPPTFSDPSPVGNWLAVKRDPFAFYARLAREAGEFAHFALPSGISVHFPDPECFQPERWAGGCAPG